MKTSVRLPAMESPGPKPCSILMQKPSSVPFVSYRENPGSKLVLSGGNWLDPVSDAKIVADTAKLLGVSEGDLILEGEL